VYPTQESMVERRSIDYVPAEERRGRVWHQGPFWFTGNFVFPTMVVGFVGPSLGLGMLWSIVAVALGACLGTFFMAFHANQGPKMGLPQMIQSRAQFGRKGAIIPFLATMFVYVGFIAFGVILVTQVINLYAPASKWIWYPVVVAIATVIAIVGYDLLHFVQRWLTYVLIAVFGVLTIGSVFVLPAHAEALVPQTSWNGAAFLIQVSVAAGYNISYAVYVSDYSRYLPANSPSRNLIAWTYLGAAASAIWLMSLGAVLGSYLTGGDAVSALAETGDLIFPGFGLIVVTGSALIALAIPHSYLSTFNGFVLLMLYFLIPWTAVNLVDFYLVRHGRYAISHIFKRDGIYGLWSWRGMVAYIAGFASMIPFFALPFFTGSIAKMLGGADVSFIPGLAVSGGLYYVLARSIDHADEAEAREHSDEILSANPKPAIEVHSPT
jgi:nucleobase:cation symporter-1, NCS1 family